jgi:hypothetical protein
MDDRELEARLRTHLHRRYGAAQPPPDLVAGVRQAVATPPRRLELPALRVRAPRVGWSMVAATALVALVAIAGLRLGGLLDPGAVSPTPHPSARAIVERLFVVLPPDGSVPSKAESTLADAVLTARLQALGVRNFTGSMGFGLEYVLPRSGPTDDDVRAVLIANGDVQFVALPPDTGGGETFTPEVGGGLPEGLPALFGWDGIASVVREDAETGPRLLITLKPAAAEAFAAHTESHVGEVFAVVIDDRIAMLPTINEPIPGGEVSLTGGSETEDFDRSMAILVGGPLPGSWRDASVPEILERDTVVESLLGELGRAGVVRGSPTVRSADLDVIKDGDRFRAAWRIVLDGDFRGECVLPGHSVSCPRTPSKAFVIDAETGDFVSSESPG